MSGRTSRQVRKEVKNVAGDMKTHLTVQILEYMEQTARKKGFFGRCKVALRYIFKKDFRGILGE